MSYRITPKRLLIICVMILAGALPVILLNRLQPMSGTALRGSVTESAESEASPWSTVTPQSAATEENIIPLQIGAVGEYYRTSFDFSLWYQLVSGSYPPGLSIIDDGTFDLHGIPEQRGSWHFTLRATDRDGEPKRNRGEGGYFDRTYEVIVTYPLDLNGDGIQSEIDWMLWKRHESPTTLSVRQKEWLKLQYALHHEEAPEVLK